MSSSRQWVTVSSGLNTASQHCIILEAIEHLGSRCPNSLLGPFWVKAGSLVFHFSDVHASWRTGKQGVFPHWIVDTELTAAGTEVVWLSLHTGNLTFREVEEPDPGLTA